MSFISKLFSRDDDEFNEVRVDREVLESVIYYSKKAYPNEFLAFFDGKIVDKGSHEELISRDGYYKEVWLEQTGK